MAASAIIHASGEKCQWLSEIVTPCLPMLTIRSHSAGEIGAMVSPCNPVGNLKDLLMFNRKVLNAATETLQQSGGGAASHSIPASRDRNLVDIPVSLVSSHANWQPAGFWSGVFDVAVWVRLPQGCQHPLQLALRYTDQRGEKTVLVDMCKPGSYKSALLNGSIALEITGRVKEMGLYLLGMPKSQAMSVDEWHFNPQIKRLAS